MELLTSNEAARFLRVSPRSLERYRVEGTGPTFAKVNGRIVYLREDLEAFVQSTRRQSTSAFGGSEVTGGVA